MYSQFLVGYFRPSARFDHLPFHSESLTHWTRSFRLETADKQKELMDASAATATAARRQPRPRVRSPPVPTRTSHSPLYDPDATILLIGMRGVGKTTLGLIAATSLRRHFIDADSAFQTLYGPISQFVSANGWPEFRQKETEILKRLVEQHPKGYVIACGGGVVEKEENRSLLDQFRKDGGPIVHVVRDEDETVRYLVDESARCVILSPRARDGNATSG